jgi:hypothetical protein
MDRLERTFPSSVFAAPAEVIDVWIRLLGAERIARLLEPGGTPWAIAGLALATGKFESALEVYRRAEARLDVALTHRLLAERLVADGQPANASVHVDEALAVYRSVGATRYIRQTERLLAASA